MQNGNYMKPYYYQFGNDWWTICNNAYGI